MTILTIAKAAVFAGSMFAYQIVATFVAALLLGHDQSPAEVVASALVFEAAFGLGAGLLIVGIAHLCRRYVLAGAGVGYAITALILLLIPMFELILVGRAIGGLSAAAVWVSLRNKSAMPCHC